MHLVLLSFRSYPFGGGEEDLRDKAAWAEEAGWKVTWVSHSKSQGKGFTERQEGIDERGARVLWVPFTTQKALFADLDSLEPDVVIAIGRMVKTMVGYKTCPWIASFHFWTGFVDLPGSFNKGILQNTDKAISPAFDSILESAARVTLVSPFMQQVGLDLDVVIPTVLPSCPTARSVFKDNYDPATRKWVTFVNGHYLKGGCLLPSLIRDYPSVPLRIILTEGDDNTAFLGDFCRAVAERNHAAPVEVLSRTRDMADVCKTTRLFVCASMVDETFGRVPAEAMASGIPVVLSKRGNLPYLGGEGAIYVNPEMPESANRSIAMLYENPSELKRLSEYYYKRSHLVSQARVKPLFLTMLNDVTRSKTKVRIMFFAPWHDQGLGTQTRAYAGLLEAAGIETVICSFATYMAENTTDKMFQADPLEWVHPRVYYSPHTREDVTDGEILECLQTYRPDAVVIPETCWHRVFEIAQLCRSMRVKVIGIPNVELIRKDEIEMHQAFDLFLANNRLCEQILKDHDLKVSWVGFALDKDPDFASLPSLPVQLTFVLVGGYNVDGRKQGPKIVRAFGEAYASVADHHRPRLIVTAQSIQSSKVTSALAKKTPGVDMRIGNMYHVEVEALYTQAHASIMPTKHEGLGMGFYEALRLACPVVTVDTQPHNEIVTPEFGWLLPGTPTLMVENTQSFIQSFDVHYDALVAWFVQMQSNPALLFEKRRSVMDNFERVHGRRAFAHRFIQGLCPGLEVPAILETKPEPVVALPPSPTPKPKPAAKTRTAPKRHNIQRLGSMSDIHPSIAPPAIYSIKSSPRLPRRPSFKSFDAFGLGRQRRGLHGPR